MPDLIFRLMEDARLDPPAPALEQERRTEIYARLAELQAEKAALIEEEEELREELRDMGADPIPERRYA